MGLAMFRRYREQAQKATSKQKKASTKKKTAATKKAGDK